MAERTTGSRPTGSRGRPARRWAGPSARLLVLLPACAAVQPVLGQSWDTKRGSAGVPRGENGVTLPISQNGATAGVTALNSRWMYTWGNTPPADVTSGTYTGEYVPMIWSANTSTFQTTVNRILGYAPALNTRYVLGFNEPERADQANMSVSTAVTIWNAMDHQFAAAGIKLVSPAVSDDTTGRAWLADFMAQATTLNLKVDAVAFHWYGGVNLSNPQASANSFLSRVDFYWNTYQKPIWITEFAGMDWGDTIPTQDLIDFNAEFLKFAVAGLESRSYVERYSWWQYGLSASGNIPASPNDTKLLDVSSGVYTPTIIGDSYAPSYGTGQTLDLKGKTVGSTIFYLKGGYLTNTTGAAVGSVRSIDAISGSSTFGGETAWNLQNGFLRVRNGATLTKVSTNQVTISNQTIENAGTVSVTGGVLELGSGLTFTSGVGTYRAAGGTLLITGNVNAMSNPIVIASGGTVIMDSANAATMASTFDVQAGGTLQIGRTTSTTNVFPDSPTSLTNNGTVIVYHTETIRNMTGTGTLIAENEESQLLSNPSFAGAILVTNGQLVPQNATAFGTAAGITTVNSNLATGNITLRDGISTGAEPITLGGRQNAAVNAAHIVNASGTNTVSSPLTLAMGGFDYNLQSDAGLLIVSGSIVSSPTGNNRNLKLVGAGSGVFSGSLAMSATANNTLIKNGLGAWTVSGAVSGLRGINVLQGQLTLSGPVSGGTVAVSGGAELVVTGTGTANSLTSYAGAGTVSFTGNVTNTVSGTLASTGRVSVAAGQVTLSNLRLANTGEVTVTGGQLELGSGLTSVSNTAAFRVSGGTILVTGAVTAMGNPFIVQPGGTLIMDSANASTMTGTFDVQPGGTLQIGRPAGDNNVFPDAPTGFTNNGTVRVLDTESLTNMTGAGTVVAEAEETQLRTNPDFTGPISVTGGHLVPRDNTALGTAAGGTTVQGNLSTGSITLRDGVSTGAEPITLVGRQSTAINSPHLLNTASTNTVAGSITLATGGTDFNLQSDLGVLSITGGIVASPATGTRNLKLLGAGTGSFGGALALNPAAVNNIIKSGNGAWTLSGAVTGVSAFQILQGRLTLAGPVAGGSVTVSPGAELAVTATGAAGGISGFSGAGTVSFSGDSTNTLAGLVNTASVSVASAAVTLAPNSGTSNLVVADVGSLTIGTNGRLTVPSHTGALASVVVTSGISIVSGVLDLTNNDMIVRDGDLSALVSMLSDGRLTSSTASPAAGPFTTLGVVANASNGLRTFATFDGVSVGPADVLVKYTYLGDTDLNGLLDARDFRNVLNGFTNGLTGWQNGDVNRDGLVNATDWSSFLAAYAWYASFGTPIGGGGDGGAVIPEPAGLGLLAAALPLTARRRRR